MSLLLCLESPSSSFREHRHWVLRVSMKERDNGAILSPYVIFGMMILRKMETMVFGCILRIPHDMSEEVVAHSSEMQVLWCLWRVSLFVWLIFQEYPKCLSSSLGDIIFQLSESVGFEIGHLPEITNWVLESLNLKLFLRPKHPVSMSWSCLRFGLRRIRSSAKAMMEVLIEPGRYVPMFIFWMKSMMSYV